jgi:hypothetical protein
LKKKIKIKKFKQKMQAFYTLNNSSIRSVNLDGVSTIAKLKERLTAHNPSLINVDLVWMRVLLDNHEYGDNDFSLLVNQACSNPNLIIKIQTCKRDFFPVKNNTRVFKNTTEAHVYNNPNANNLAKCFFSISNITESNVKIQTTITSDGTNSVTIPVQMARQLNLVEYSRKKRKVTLQPLLLLEFTFDLPNGGTTTRYIYCLASCLENEWDDVEPPRHHEISIDRTLLCHLDIHINEKLERLEIDADSPIQDGT